MSLQSVDFEEEINEAVEGYYKEESEYYKDIDSVIFHYSVYADWLEGRDENYRNGKLQNVGWRWLYKQKIIPYEERLIKVACSGVFDIPKTGYWQFSHMIISTRYDYPNDNLGTIICEEPQSFIGLTIFNKLVGRMFKFWQAPFPILPLKEVVRYINRHPETKIKELDRYEKAGLM